MRDVPRAVTVSGAACALLTQQRGGTWGAGCGALTAPFLKGQVGLTRDAVRRFEAGQWW